MPSSPSVSQIVGIAPCPGNPLWVGSGNVANAQAQVTLPAATGLVTYITGFDIDGLGATAGAALAVTVAGLAIGTITMSIGVPAGATVPFGVQKRFPNPLPALVSSVIVVTVPAAGAGNTALSLVAYGFQL